jgi:hypothetical protein
VPVALIVVSIFQEVTVFRMALLVAVLAFSIYSGNMSRKALFKQKD